MIWPWLTWSQIFKLSFQCQKVMFRTGLVRRTWWCHFYFRISQIKKSYEWKTISLKTTIFHLMAYGAKTIDLRSNLIGERCRSMRRASQCFFRILPSHYTFGDDSDCLRKKSLFSRSLNFGDHWWPQYWPGLKLNFLKDWDLVTVHLMPLPDCR